MPVYHSRLILYVVLFACHREIKEKLRLEVLEAQRKLPGVSPGLAIVQVGGREDSNVYIRMKLSSAAAIGINAQHIKFPRDGTTETDVLNKVRKSSIDDQ